MNCFVFVICMYVNFGGKIYVIEIWRKQKLKYGEKLKNLKILKFWKFGDYNCF